MDKFKRAAIEVLKKANKPLHYTKITQLALEAGILETEGATPQLSINSRIGADIKNKKDASDFIKVAPATFALNLNKKELKQKQKIEEKEKEIEEKINIESSFTGKAGEYLVCSQLLFRGFNASIMSVDTGMDIAAIKNNKLFGIQVKTANLNRYNSYNFNVRRVSFERYDSGNVFYIFVLHEGSKNHFLILSYQEMKRKVYERAILQVRHGKLYRVKIELRGENIYLGNRNHEMSYFKNNWDVIK